MAHILGNGPNGDFRIDLPPVLRGTTGHELRLAGFNGYSTNSAIFGGRLSTSGGSFVDNVMVKFQRLLKDSRVDRFHNEVRIMTALDHPRIAKVYEHGSVAAQGVTVPWMAVERGGTNLWNAVEPGIGLQPALLKSLGTQMCEALTFLHGQSIIHRH